MASTTKVESFSITVSIPTGPEYLHLRSVSGLTAPPVPVEVVEAALSQSVRCLVARTESGEAVGMLRLLGDGHIFLNLYDMCVVPEHQGRGIGAKMLDQMLSWVDEHAPKAYVNLIGDPPGQAMYRKRGFKQPNSLAMVRSQWGWDA